ncbi:type IV pilus inner membrane component PilO [Desulfotruncus alcoholivorax]|uniref:type 4a pilus biogenesis protein PilO n=1 Tax=Desulfotruncus alcoholivorax TaxID=265477 RepID=UPI000422DC0C|nr:type 4a pilus biogenesis protein PilO [Desulfotruncus alcoholivorax]
MNGMQRKDKLVLLSGVAVLLLVCFLLFNQINALKSARAELAANRDALAQARTRLQNLIQLKDKSAELREKSAQIEKALPAGPGENNLIEQINSIFAQAGVDLLQINFQERVTQKGYVEMPLNLTCRGSFNDLFNLITGLQNGTRAMRIDAVKLAKDSQDPAYLKADLSVSVFYLAQ